MKELGTGVVRPVRVLVVDDHEVLADSLALALGAEPGLLVVGKVHSLAAARAALLSGLPDVVLLDHSLPDGQGVAAIGELLELKPGVRVVVLTASTSDHVLVAAMEAGAAGFVDKSRGLAEVAAAVKAAAAGESVVSAKLLARLLPRLRGGAPPGVGADLTEREREVLSELARGRSNAQIANELGVSVNTVRNHVANLSVKLGAHSKLEAMSIAVQEGLLLDL